MRWLAIAGSVVLLANAQQFAIHVNHHPAAGPDFLQQDLGRTLFSESSLAAPDGRLEGSIESDNRNLFKPLKEFSIRREEQLRLEAEEIARVLAARRDHSQSISLATWVWCMLGCAAVVSCGIIPAFLLPKNSGEFLQSEEGCRKLNLLLSFAVGSLLGDVFLHLIPESWASYDIEVKSVSQWTIGGLILCFIVEKVCSGTEASQHKICAIMNIIANIVDNFTHGLAVGGSFLVSTKFGIITTSAILLHEIPHEVSDFAILLRADYDRMTALKAQALSATAGVLGSCLALWLYADGEMGGAASWILPFTAGGFINIALVQILPELMKETNRKENGKQLVLMISGVAVMAVINQFHF